MSITKITRTTSWPEGLHEEEQFVPYLTRPIRRTQSEEDVQKFKDHFQLARRNQGKDFTWKIYVRIALDFIKPRHLPPFGKKPTTSESETFSLYVTASEPECKKEVKSESVKSKKRPSTGTPQSALKKMCSEIRTLAQKTCQSVDRISTKANYCAACGNRISRTKDHKKCWPNIEKPITPSMLKRTQFARKRSSSADSSSKSSRIIFVNSTAKKLKFTPDSAKKLKTISKR